MIVNIRIELPDTERETMFQNLTGTEYRRKVSRAQVREFVEGCVEAASRRVMLSPTPEAIRAADAPASSFTAAEQSEIERLRADGKSDSYIRGWLQVGRRLAA